MRLTMFAVAILCTAATTFGQVAANLVLKEGDTVGSSTVSSLNQPFTNGLGQVGFNAILDDGTRSIWFNGAEIFNSADALPDSLTGGEGTMGFGDNAEFIYSPSFNGADAVYGQGGLILEENTPAPGFPANINSTFHSRPQMTDDGTAYWISGFNDGAGGTSSQGRMLYRRNPAGMIDVVITAGDLVGGVPVDDGSGVGFDFHASGNNAHVMVEVNLDTGSTADDSRVLVNGAVVAAEASPTGQGDNWDNFDVQSINNSGNYVFSGDTDGASTADEFIAYNGAIQLRQGDVISAGTLDGSVDAVSINNLNQVAFIWDLNGAETLLVGDAANLASSMALASVGDTLDTNNDGLADWTLSDFNASAGIGPGIDFAEDGLVYVEVDLDSLTGGPSVEAIVSFVVPEPASLGGLLLGSWALLAGVRRRRN